MKYLAVFLVVLIGCSSTTKKNPMVSSSVNSFSESNILKSDPHYFYTENMSLPEKQISSKCKKAAIEFGINVVEVPCKECKIIVIKGNTPGSHTESGITLAPTFSTANFGSSPNVNMYGSQPVQQSWNVTDREIEIHVFDGSIKGKEILNSKISSSGSTTSLPPVALEMCFAGFAEYPENMSGRRFSFESSEE